jgi:hypothetical protein
MVDFKRVGDLSNLIAPDFEVPVIRPPNMAQYAVEAIYDEIAEFEASLDEDYEVGMPIVGGPANLCVHVRKVYRFGTDKLVFVGIDSDQHPVRLVQHLSQLNFLMLSVKKMTEKSVRIGFHSPNK